MPTPPLCSVDAQCSWLLAGLIHVAPLACTCPPAAMKLPKYEGNEVAEATAQFAALSKEAEALVAMSSTRITEIKVRAAGRWLCS